MTAEQAKKLMTAIENLVQAKISRYDVQIADALCELETVENLKKQSDRDIEHAKAMLEIELIGL